MKKVSILISTYKSECHIHRAIDNLQCIYDKNDVEIVWVANDVNSIEDEALKRAALIFGSSIKIIHVQRESLYSSWNRAIEQSTAEIFTIYNIDDYRFIDSFNDQVDFHFSDKEINIVYSSFLINKNFLRVFQQISVEDKKNNAFTNSMIIGPYFSFSKKERFKNNFDEQFKVAGDFDFQIRRAYEGKIEKISTNAGIYFDNSQGLSTSGFVQLLEEQVVNLRYNIKDKLYPFFSFFIKFTTYEPFDLTIYGKKIHISDACENYDKICQNNSDIALSKNFIQKIYFYYYAIKFYSRLFSFILKK